MRRSHFLRYLLGAALLAVLLAACGTPAAPVATDPDPDDPQQPVPPSITGFSPAAAVRGSSVVITGHDFGEEIGTVTIGGAVAEVSRWTGTTIEATVPEGAPNAWQDLSVSTEGGAAAHSGLFVGAEFTGDGDGLQEFLELQPQGGAVLLGAGTYAVPEEVLLVDNVDLYGRGADETELQLPELGVVLADFGAVTTIADLSTSGGPLTVTGGTFADIVLPPSGGGYAGLSGLTDVRAYVGELGALASPRLGLEPTIVLSGLDLGGGMRGLPSQVGTFDLEVHDSSISMPGARLLVQTTGDVLLSGVTSSSGSATLISLRGSLQISNSDLRFDDAALMASGGVSISGSALAALDGNLQIIGEDPSALDSEVAIPGGPIMITGSSLRALAADQETSGLQGNIHVYTWDAPISLTDNLELSSHGYFEVEAGRGPFGKSDIEFARNRNVQVGVFAEEAGAYSRASNLNLRLYDSGNVANHVTFSENALSISNSLNVVGDSGPFSLEFSDNTGMIGIENSFGGLFIEGEIGGSATLNSNDLQVRGGVGVGLEVPTEASLRMADNRFVHPDSGLQWFSLYAFGFSDVLVAGNEVAVQHGIEFYFPFSEAAIAGNRFSMASAPMQVLGTSFQPAIRVAFTENEIEYGHLVSGGPLFVNVGHAIIEGNRVSAESTEEGVIALAFGGGSSMAAHVTGNTFTGFGRALALSSGSADVTMDMTINHNVFDFEIGGPGSAAELNNVGDVVDARYNVWGSLTDVADVEAALLFSGDTEAMGGGILLDPITVP